MPSLLSTLAPRSGRRRCECGGEEFFFVFAGVQGFTGKVVGFYCFLLNF